MSAARRWGAIRQGLLLGLLIGAGPSGAQSSAVPTPWQEEVAAAREALAMGDAPRARQAIDGLAALRPQSALPQYLSARLLEGDGLWGTAADRYLGLLLAHGTSLDPRWQTLVAGRWVRARQRRSAAIARTAMQVATPPPMVAGRLLVLPLDPLVLESSAADRVEELGDLGVAAAAWILEALGQISGLRPLGMQETLLLRRGEVPAERARAETGAPAVPPVTTWTGAAYRLARMVPRGAPPWASAASAPEHYLAREEGRPAEIARSLAHFQSEQELAPTGILDPETRQALERAFRAQRAPQPVRPRLSPGEDRLLGLARRAGVAAVLTGTLEPLLGGELRWHVAWLDAGDGRVCGGPLEGILTRERFGEAWQRMVARVREAAPGTSEEALAAALALPSPPSLTGARLQGRAQLALGLGTERVAAELLAQAAREGAGASTAWLARAWGPSSLDLARIEDALLEEEIWGPARLAPEALAEAAARLSGGLFHGAVPWGGGPGAGRATPLAALPERGWLRISGEVE